MSVRVVSLAVICLVSVVGAPRSAVGATATSHPEWASSKAVRCKVVVKSVHGRRKAERVCTGRRHTGPLFASPSDLVVDAHGRVFVADQGTKSILKLSPKGKVLARWTRAGSNPPAFTQLYGIALDHSGDVYVSDAASQVVDKVSSKGKPLAQWNTGAAAANSFPTLLAVASNGDVYLSDHGAEAVLHLSPTGALLDKIGVHVFTDPYGVTLGPDGNLYVTDFGAGLVREFTPEGGPVATWGNTPRAVKLQNPEAIAVDASGNIYVSEQTGQIVKFNRSGKVLTRWRPTRSLTLQDPSGIALDSHGNLYVAEYMGNRVDKLSPTGRLLAVWR